MLKITRIYNQNRFKFWTIAIIVIFIIAIIQICNKSYINEKGKKISNQEENLVQSNIVNYKDASDYIISTGNVKKDYRDNIQKTLENFLVYCCNGQVEEAYELLTDQCKELLYPSVEIFNENYCKNIYNKKRTYSFQAWSKDNYSYVYLVKIFEDMLSTGRDSTRNYIQDYITITYLDGEYLLNINNFINSYEINKEVEKKDVKVKVKGLQRYMDYEIYQFEITNNSDKEIWMDSLKEDDSTYVLNQDLIHIRALLYENKEEELKVAPGETKQIFIKFNNAYIASNYISRVVFSNIIIDEEKYKKDSQATDAVMQLEVSLR